MTEAVSSLRLLTTTTVPSGETCQSGSVAHANGGDYLAPIQVDDGNVRRAGVGDVGALAVRGNRDEVRRPMHSDGRDHLVALSIDDADVVGLGVGDVDFILLRIGGNTGRICSHRDRLDIAQRDVDDADRIALAVGDVGVLVVPGIGRLAPAAARHRERKKK